MTDGKIDLAAMPQEKRVYLATQDAALHIDNRMSQRVKDDMAEMPDGTGVLEIQHMATGRIDVEIRLLEEVAANQCYFSYRLESGSRNIDLSLIGPTFRCLIPSTDNFTRIG